MENIVIFVMVISLLIWVVTVIYTLFVSSPYKRDDNLNFGEIDIEQAKQIWKEKLEYPYCKSIYTNEEGNLDITGKYATYKVKFNDGKMVIEDKAKPFAKPGNVVEEKDCLEAYLVKLLLPETDINTPRALAHFRKYIKARIIRRISGWLFFIVLILYVFHTSGIHLTDVTDIWNSKGVSMMQLTEYSDEITIGEALRTACPKGKWKSNKIDKGLYRVVFNGYGMNGSLLTMVFQSQDWSQCTIQSIAIDEQDYTLFGGLFLEALFANAGDAASLDNEEEQEFLETVDEYIDEGVSTSDETEVIDEEEAVPLERADENDNDLEMELSEDEDLYDNEVQGEMDDIIPVWELSGHYAGIIGAQSVMDISIYTAESEDGSIGNADIYVEGGQYSYYANIYEVAANLYWVAVDTGEEVFLSPYRDGEYIVMQLYVDGECITEYLLTSQFQS